MMAFIAFVKLTRPVFLLGGIFLYGLGTAIAFAQGVAINISQALIGQGIVTFIQLMAQYANEYFDVEGDRLNARGRTYLSGGSGVLPAGEIAPRTALLLARTCAMLAVLVIVFFAVTNPLVGITATVALLGSWFYSAPPLSLMKSGWGEVTTSLIVALFVPLTGYLVQTHRFDSIVLWVCSPLVLIHWAMLLAFQLPDYAADIAIGKRTQTVRLGRQNVRGLHTTLLVSAIALIAFFALNLTPYGRYLWLLVPLLALQAYLYWTASKACAVWRGWNWLTFGATAVFTLTTLAWLVGFASSLR